MLRLDLEPLPKSEPPCLEYFCSPFDRGEKDIAVSRVLFYVLVRDAPGKGLGEMGLGQNILRRKGAA